MPHDRRQSAYQGPEPDPGWTTIRFREGLRPRKGGPARRGLVSIALGRREELTRRFIGALKAGRSEDLDFVAHLVVLLTTNFVERTTDEGTTGAELIRQADLLTDILVAHFRIG